MSNFVDIDLSKLYLIACFMKFSAFKKGFIATAIIIIVTVAYGAAAFVLPRIIPNAFAVSDAAEIRSAATEKDGVTSIESGTGKIEFDEPLTASSPLRIYKNNGSLFLGWRAASGADEYEIEANGFLFASVTVCRAEISSVLERGGRYTFSVFAIADGMRLSEVSCSFDYYIELDTPTGLTVSEDVLIWNEVECATGYTVSVGGIKYPTVKENRFPLSDKTIPGKEYAITVQAFNDSEYSAYYTSSASAEFLYAAPILPDRPDNLFVAVVRGQLIASFAPVVGAKAYSVTVTSENSVEFTTDKTCFDISDHIRSGVNYYVSVKAICGGFESESSVIGFKLLNGRILLEYETEGNGNE